MGQGDGSVGRVAYFSVHPEFKPQVLQSGTGEVILETWRLGERPMRDFPAIQMDCE